MDFEVCENPGRAWDAFVACYTDLPFYSSAWLRVLEQGLGGRPCCLYLKDASGILGGVPGVALGYYGIRLFYSAIPYGGYLGDLELFHRFMNDFVERTKRYDMVYLLPYSPGDDLPYRDYFVANGEVATRIELQGRQLKALQSCFEPSVRQSINKGAKLGLEVTCGLDRESFLVAHRLYLQTMRRNRAIARYPEKWFVALHDVLALDGKSSVYLVHHGGMPISATVVIESSAGSHLLHSGSSEKHLHLRAKDLVVCKIIEDSVSAGKQYVDFMPSDPTDTALIRWKEKFGGVTVRLNKYSRINSPGKYFLWQSAKKIYPVMRHPLKRGAPTRP